MIMLFIGPLNGPGVRDAIPEKGYSAIQSIAYFWENITQAISDTSKGTVSTENGRIIGSFTFKATKDFVKVNKLCLSLCTILINYASVYTLTCWKIYNTRDFKGYIRGGNQIQRSMCE